MDDRRTDREGGGTVSDLSTPHRSRTLLRFLCSAIAVLVFGITAVRFYVASRQPIKKATLLRFADFQYARELTKANVTRLLGPATSCNPLKPGFAECCNWEVVYPALVGSDSYRLTLSFDRTRETEVVAGGLYKNDKVVRSK
jgi:hypothetical protein